MCGVKIQAAAAAAAMMDESAIWENTLLKKRETCVTPTGRRRRDFNATTVRMYTLC